MKKNKKLTGFLVVVLAAIWGSIGFQIVAAFDDADVEPGSDMGMNVAVNAETVKYVYKNDVRDPFMFFKPTLRGKGKKIETAPALVVPPPYKLTGIIADRQKKTALLESTDGSIYFLREGESVGAVKIIRIAEKHVDYLYAKVKASWKLQENQ